MLGVVSDGIRDLLLGLFRNFYVMEHFTTYYFSRLKKKTGFYNEASTKFLKQQGIFLFSDFLSLKSRRVKHSTMTHRFFVNSTFTVALIVIGQKYCRVLTEHKIQEKKREEEYEEKGKGGKERERRTKGVELGGEDLGEVGREEKHDLSKLYEKSFNKRRQKQNKEGRCR